mgnify:CR=1 FL=1
MSYDAIRHFADSWALLIMFGGSITKEGTTRPEGTTAVPLQEGRGGGGPERFV